MKSSKISKEYKVQGTRVKAKGARLPDKQLYKQSFWGKDFSELNLTAC